jgi:hypothetical protein
VIGAWSSLWLVRSPVSIHYRRDGFQAFGAMNASNTTTRWAQSACRPGRILDATRHPPSDARGPLIAELSSRSNGAR